MKAFSIEEKLTLILIAKKIIEEELFGKSDIKVREIKSLEERKQGVFVTINKDNKLRGCIGLIESNEPITKTIERLAYSSAFKDPRFKPINIKEYKKIWIEISILSKPKRISSIEEIIINKHGLIVSLGEETGLLLPQVAKEQNWDRKTLLENTCIKASLPIDEWKHGAEIETFEATVFNEKVVREEYKNYCSEATLD